ncbi:Probable lipoprotein precursor [Flavobacterium indicum GPTSA100-9 = DSM 17447]|uniref:Probable lipoprotein n=1 Tax=Flavobacterium indicum (strain DSM 17447 / CIP 109464 / GPTSA100-9) TaxID=1094466 RepID=H8XQT1_FLAIG|nr:protease complex subunit PrcB family protein [Flavobacterium indicum]CCG53379.1 Probable lipoprotein precursor [Flavobacterium indicum GPTSA100-9 = DSM 17447]
MNKLIVVVIISIFTFLLSCKTQPAPSNIIVEKELETYKVIYKGQISSKKVKENIVIKDNESFTNLISELNIQPADYEVLLNVDFEKNNLLVLFIGEKPTGGYDIDVDKVLFLEKTIEVYPKISIPSKDSFSTTAITSPYVMVTISKGKEIIVK